jgi:signal transduction histidine kinase
MSDTRALGEQEASRSDGLKRMSMALHDLCQPLTTLQCRLEMAGVVGTAEAYREAVEMGLVECARLVDAVGSMREVMRAAIRDAAAADARTAG